PSHPTREAPPATRPARAPRERTAVSRHVAAGRAPAPARGLHRHTALAAVRTPVPAPLRSRVGRRPRARAGAALPGPLARLRGGHGCRAVVRRPTCALRTPATDPNVLGHHPRPA